MVLPKEIVNAMYREVNLYLGTDMHVDVMAKLRSARALLQAAADGTLTEEQRRQAGELAASMPAKTLQG